MRKPQAPLSGRTILVVDDQDETLNSMRKLLEREGHRVLTADRGAKALALLAEHDVHVMLIDYFMPVMNGELLIRAIRNRNTTVQIILQTGYAGEKPPRDMMRRLDIQGYHDKCDGPERLLLWVDAALKNYDQIMRLQGAAPPAGDRAASVMPEVRRRLNAMVGDVGLVRRGAFGPVSAETVSVLDDVITTGAALLELTEGDLDPATMRACSSPVRLEPIDVARFLREVTQLLVPSSVAGRRRRRLENPDPPLVAMADRTRLRAIMESLVSDAAKTTPEAEIELSATARDDGRVALRVANRGAGIAPAERAAVFDVALELRSRAARGVAVARCVARAMGGDITLECGPGDRTTFTLVLPAAEGQPATSHAAVANRGAL